MPGGLAVETTSSRASIAFGGPPRYNDYDNWNYGRNGDYYNNGVGLGNYNDYYNGYYNGYYYNGAGAGNYNDYFNGVGAGNGYYYGGNLAGYGNYYNGFGYGNGFVPGYQFSTGA